MKSLLKYTHILMALAVLPLLAGCSDDPIGTPYSGVFPEGETLVRATLDFEPFAANSVGSRASDGNGKLLDRIDDLCVIVYDTDGNLVEGFPVEITEADNNLDVKAELRGDADASNNKTAESATMHATFDIRLPYGRYYVYGVANLGSMNPDGLTREKTITLLTEGKYKDAVKKREDLLTSRMEWDNADMLNNCEMLGYFTAPKEKTSPFTGADMNNKTVVIDKPGIEIHSWLRRCASKVTVDFDGSGLFDNIKIYLRRATIHDLPDACALGRKNAVSGENGLKLILNKNNDNYGQIHPEWEAPTPGTHYHPENNGTNYRPDAAAVKNGVDYGEGDKYEVWPCVSKTQPKIKDAAGNDIDFHHEKAQAMYIYENMQGDGLEDKKANNKEQEVDPSNGSVAGATTDKKDGMDYGSYIEVEGYYAYDTEKKKTAGKIIYRFMLGKDAIKNFDVERNHHYKITMCPRGYGNDVDWHIEYSEESGFEFEDPYYVSYLYNHDSTIRFRYNPPEGVTVDSIQAEIIANNWWPESGSYSMVDMEAQIPYLIGEDPMYEESYRADNIYTEGDLKGRRRYLGNGFLSLREPTDYVVIKDNQVKPSKVKGNNGTEYWFPVASQNVTPEQVEVNKSMNDNYFYGHGLKADGKTPDKIDRSRRTYYFEGTKDETKKEREDYKMEKYPDGSLRFNLPVFTRAKNLVKASSYTGNNLFESAPRMAYVRMKVFLSNGDTPSQILRVQQVTRITNPKGIYRKSGNNENFHVVLTEKTADDSKDAKFESVVSDGPWMAEVIGDVNFINLNGRSTIKGASGTEIQFNVRFNKMNRDNTVRNAVIRVRYHNYSCVHLIFVRQGYSSQAIESSETHWHTCNKITGSEEALDPRDEGSLFRFGNLSQPIDVYSNFYTCPGTSPASFGAVSDLRIAETRTKYSDKPVSWSNIRNSFNFNADTDIAQMSDFEKLYTTKYVEQGFGVLYGDGAIETQTTLEGAYGWYRHMEDQEERDKRGMLGVFVYYWDRNSPGYKYNCRNFFLPIGRSGYGHRRQKENGILRYSCGQTGPYNSVMRPWFPLFDDIYKRRGAIYWSRQLASVMETTGTRADDAVGLDMNFFSFDFNAITAGNVSTAPAWNSPHSARTWDACFVRGVGEQKITVE